VPDDCFKAEEIAKADSQVRSSSSSRRRREEKICSGMKPP